MFSQFSHFKCLFPLLHICVRSREISILFRRVVLLGIMVWATQVSELIQSSGPILSRYTRVMELLEQNLQTTQQRILPDLIVVHPSNRGSLGLNPYNVHRIASLFHLFFSHCIVFVLIVSVSLQDWPHCPQAWGRLRPDPQCSGHRDSA